MYIEKVQVRVRNSGQDSLNTACFSAGTAFTVLGVSLFQISIGTTQKECSYSYTLPMS